MTSSFAARIAINNCAIVIRGDWTGTRYNPAQPKRQGAITYLWSVVSRSLGQTCSSRARRDVQGRQGYPARLNPVHVTPTILRRALQACKQSARCISKCFEVLSLHVFKETTGVQASCAKNLSHWSKQ